MQDQEFLERACQKFGKGSGDKLLKFLNTRAGHPLPTRELRKNYEELKQFKDLCDQLKAKGSKLKHIDPNIKRLMEEFLKKMNEGISETSSEASPSSARETPTEGSASSLSAARSPILGAHIASDSEAAEVVSSGWLDEPQPKDYCGHFPERTCPKPQCRWERNRCRAVPDWHETASPKDRCGHFVSRETCIDPTCEWKGRRCQPRRDEVKPRTSRQGSFFKFPSRLTSGVVSALALAGNVIPSQQSRSLTPPGMFPEIPLQPHVVGLAHEDSWWHNDPSEDYHGTRTGDLRYSAP